MFLVMANNEINKMATSQLYFGALSSLLIPLVVFTEVISQRMSSPIVSAVVTEVSCQSICVRSNSSHMPALT